MCTNTRHVQTDVIKIHQTARNSRRVGWGTREKLEALVYRALPHDYTRAKGAILEVKRRRLIGATRRMRLPARTARFIAPMGCFRLTSMSADGACNVLSSVGRQVRHWPGLNNAWSDCLTLQQSRVSSLNIGNFSLFHLYFVLRQNAILIVTFRLRDFVRNYPCDALPQQSRRSWTVMLFK